MNAYSLGGALHDSQAFVKCDSKQDPKAAVLKGFYVRWRLGV